MKLVRYRSGKEIGYGAVIGGAGSIAWRLVPGNPRSPGEALASLDEVDLLAPCEPTKIVAVGRNYAAHAAEHDAPVPDEPILFLKPPSSVIGPGEAIVHPGHLSRRVDHEAELAVVIGQRARRVSREEALALRAWATPAPTT